VDEDLAGLVTAAIAGGPSRARLFEVAAAGRTSRDGSLDVVLDDLARRAVGGDDGATELVLEVVHRLGLARSAITPIVSDATAVDDVAQATLMTVERRIGSFQGRSKFRTWLFTVARNEALMTLRPKSAEPVAEVPAGGARFSSIVAFQVTMEGLVDGLPDPYRGTMRLQAFENLDYEAIAARLGIPVGTVRSRLSKARDLLWSAMKEEKATQHARPLDM
jgi:RNA polymerase sigma-70 factor (ECF subfamily)